MPQDPISHFITQFFTFKIISLDFFYSLSLETSFIAVTYYMLHFHKKSFHICRTFKNIFLNIIIGATPDRPFTHALYNVSTEFTFRI